MVVPRGANGMLSTVNGIDRPAKLEQRGLGTGNWGTRPGAFYRGGGLLGINGFPAESLFPIPDLLCGRHENLELPTEPR